MIRMLGLIMLMGGAFCLGMMWSTDSPNTVFKYGIAGNLLVFPGIALSAYTKSALNKLGDN
jgi:hypothetical protein